VPGDGVEEQEELLEMAEEVQVQGHGVEAHVPASEPGRHGGAGR
jgi:hypothetical protein